MRVVVVFCAIWLPFLSLISTAQPLHSVSGASSKATTLSCTTAPNGGASCVDGDEDDSETDVSFTGVPGTARERSFFAVKPDGLQRGLVGEIVSRFERKGWKLVALKMLIANRSLVERHYEEHIGKEFFEKLVNYMSSGPVVAMVWEGKGVIAAGRKLLGSTNPLDAEVGTIRGDFCTSAGRNLVHMSDGPESAEREIALWFREEEAVHWSRSIDPWISRSL